MTNPFRCLDEGHEFLCRYKPGACKSESSGSCNRPLDPWDEEDEDDEGPDPYYFDAASAAFAATSSDEQEREG